MKSKIFAFVIVLVFLISFTSSQAQPITLYNLSIQTNETWCFGEFIGIKIIPLNMNGTFTKVNSLEIHINSKLEDIENISLNNMTLEKSPLYLKENGYFTSLKISSNSITPPKNLSFVFVVTAEQRGKTLEKNKTIEIVGNCTKKSKFYQFFLNLEDFLVAHSSFIIVSLAVVLIIVLIIKISLLKS